ncbi:hypothetical protein [Algoriphagus pacificus]|uniref:Uncharacterized protein n=1 Tax=Algoriphagus pacificus TaxID=2811234 RepID=A0ABS3CK70_9BACT|nr:hypothetical protein [Algoriphagus pacificus]MBN7817503.1 hypothetical protein [Algoriphagus pacificus]
MNSIQFSSVAKNILQIGERKIFAQFIRLQEIQRGAFGITAVDRLYPLKPKKPV